LQDKDPRIALTAAMVLAGTGGEEDAARAESVLSGLVSDTRESAAPVRRDFAIAIRRVSIPHFRRLLIPLLNDPNPGVADEAMRSIQRLGAADFFFVPTLISLLRSRRQKSSARALLMGFGEPVLPILHHFLRDPGEDHWVRRHIPATISRIPCQKAMDILLDALDEKDGFLRFQAIAALEKIHRIRPELSFDRHRIESLIRGESVRYVEYRRLRRVLTETHNYPKESLLARAIAEKMKRGVDRIYRLLSLLYPWKEIAGARYAIERGDQRSRAGTLEYLDNLLVGALRKTLIPLLEDAPPGLGPSSGNTSSDVEAVVLQLIHDEDPVVASAAIYFAWQQKLPQLSCELDRMLAAPDAWDRRVLETADWVLQELRRPEPKARLIWLEPLPPVDLANQMHRLPLFGSVSVDEVFRICDSGRQMRYEAGRLLCQETLVPEKIQFLLNGRVAVARPDGETRQVEAPAVLAFEEVMEERPMAESVRTTDISVCLTLTSEELRDLLADNSNLVQGLFQMLCRATGQAGRMVVKGPAPHDALLAGGDLSPIEKGLVLKTIPVFSQVSPDEIIPLASVATEVKLMPGSELFVETDRPAIYALLSGSLSIESRGESAVTAGPSDVIGIYETLAGMNFEFRARVEREGIALRIDREDLFDLLSQRSALLRQVFGALFRNRPAAAAAS
jgi:CRP-like cAMP-binding protein